MTDNGPFVMNWQVTWTTFLTQGTNEMKNCLWHNCFPLLWNACTVSRGSWHSLCTPICHHLLTNVHVTYSLPTPQGAFWYSTSSIPSTKSYLFPYDLHPLAPVRIFPFSTKEVVMVNSNSHHRMDDHSPTRLTHSK